MTKKKHSCGMCGCLLTSQNKSAGGAKCKPCWARYCVENKGVRTCADCGAVLPYVPGQKRKQRCEPCRLSHVRKLRQAEPNRQKPRYRRKYHRDAAGRECKTCREYKTWESFPKHGGAFNVDGTVKRRAVCKECKPPKKRPVGWSGRRNRRMAKAKPAWRDHKKMRDIGNRRQELRDTTGLEYHIDHIVPLRGTIAGVRLVSGLHWEGNLQILRDKDNMAKGGHAWPDMPEYTEADLERLR